MDEIAVVTCFLRHDAEVLLLCRSDGVESDRGQWGAVAARAEGDPDAAARREIAEETGLGEAVTLLRRGDAFDVLDEERDTRWIVHPSLFACEHRRVETDREHEWVHPTEILRRETVPDLWESYDRVRPTVETVRTDREHGSAWLSVRALEVLRDEAGAAARADGGDHADLATVARRLRDARPSMPAIANRVDRAMARADRRAERLERTARAGIAEALTADDAAAAAAADRLPDRIATLSRSGTVRAAIDRADPEAVLIAESRPGGEGVAVAEDLAGQTDVTLSSDAGFAWALHDHDVEAVLVGADAIAPDGTVANKVGTRAAALSAAHEGIDLLVVAATDKVSADGVPPSESGDPATVYDGPADVAVDATVFDLTPATVIDALCTDRGVLTPDGIEDVAADHRENADWIAEW